MKTPLLKAKATFFTLNRLFYNHYLDQRLKNLSLYGTDTTSYYVRLSNLVQCQCLDDGKNKNISERECLRACLSQYSSAKTNYFYYISNKKNITKRKYLV